MGMPDHTQGSDPDPAATPDYALDEVLAIRDPAQYAALFEPTRLEIISLLLDRAATTSELAETMGKPKGTIGHHLKALEAAGLVQVVRTQRVRALEAKYYGRTARLFLFDKSGDLGHFMARGLRIAAEEVSESVATGLDAKLPLSVGVRYARIPAERAEEWNQRVHQLLDEFNQDPRGGGVTFGLVAGIFPTSRRRLPDPQQKPQATNATRPPPRRRRKDPTEG